MRDAVPFLVILMALLVTTLSLFSEGGVRQLWKLGYNLEQQRNRQHEIENYVHNLESEVRALKYDRRALEKAARDELGMMKEDEYLFFFDDQSEQDAEAD